MSETVKITISLPQELVALVDSIACQKKINRSQVMADCLKEIAVKRKHDLLKDGYLFMAEEHQNWAEYFRTAQAEILHAGKNIR
jgi:metal-responsive CopG/Arc/MetJ family transcriptional regulator